MNKLKNVFQRSQKVVEERRPQQFMKRLASANTSTPVEISQKEDESPTINFSDLSEMEKIAYQSWWKDLDPFELGKINNQTTMKFLNGCTLEDNKLEQILALFESAGEELNQIQFFAMLRLIAHAQNGRKVSKALVYLGAPVPLFHTNAIDALIKSDVSRVDIKKPPERASWWGNEIQQSSNNRHSYIGPFTAHNPVPNSISQQNQSYFLDNEQLINPSTSPLFPRKNDYTHSRSKSAGNAINYKHPLDLEEQLQPSRSSLSLHEINNTGKSLLLTQEFIYQSPSTRKKELPTPISNPFHSDVCSPFDDENNSDEKSLEHTPILNNNKPNTFLIPPPPVPSQATKPAFPKYTRSHVFDS